MPQFPRRGPRGTPVHAKSGSQALGLGARAAAVMPGQLGSVPGRGQRLGVKRLATSDPSGRCPRRSLRSCPCRGPGPAPAPARPPQGPRPAPPLPPPPARRRPGSRAVNPSSDAGSRPRRRGRPWPQPAPCPGRVVARRARRTPKARGPASRPSANRRHRPLPDAVVRALARAANQRAPSRPPRNCGLVALGAPNWPAAGARAHL